MKISRKELRELLEINENSLKSMIKRNVLEANLNKKGYTIKEEIKEGRNKYYILEEININTLNYYKDCIQTTYNTKDHNDSFTKNLIAKDILNKNSICASKKQFAKYCNVSEKTISNWDNKLIELNILQKDDFYYFCIDTEYGNIYQCSKEEYKSYWRNISTVKNNKNNYNKILEMVYNKEITIEQANKILQQKSKEDIQQGRQEGQVIGLITGRYYYRVKKYKINTNNNLYLETIELIKLLYNDLYIQPLEDKIKKLKNNSITYIENEI